jgi:hypothetical protein
MEICDTGNMIVNNINLNGFHNTMCEGELYMICDNLFNYLESNKGKIPSCKHWNRSYEITYKNKYIDDQLNLLKANQFLNEIAAKYLCKKYSVICAIKTSFPTNNLNPLNTGFYHRDTQRQKCLKVIIYLSDVGDYNGSLKVICPEINSNKLIWYNENNIPRTTEDEIIKCCGKESILTLNGPKYSCIFLEGSTIHSGGYVQIGSRDSVYMEFII